MFLSGSLDGLFSVVEAGLVQQQTWDPVGEMPVIGLPDTLLGFETTSPRTVFVGEWCRPVIPHRGVGVVGSCCCLTLVVGCGV